MVEYEFKLTRFCFFGVAITFVFPYSRHVAREIPRITISPPSVSPFLTLRFLRKCLPPLLVSCSHFRLDCSLLSFTFMYPAYPSIEQAFRCGCSPISRAVFSFLPLRWVFPSIFRAFVSFPPFSFPLLGYARARLLLFPQTGGPGPRATPEDCILEPAWHPSPLLSFSGERLRHQRLARPVRSFLRGPFPPLFFSPGLP